MLMSNLVNVAVTGAAGQIGYTLLFCLGSGKIFGPDTHVALRLLEIPPAMKALEGAVMELEDCAFHLLDSVEATDDPRVAFDGVNWALMLGSRPRGKGMERGDLIRANGPIFVEQGQALAARAAGDLRVVVVGNPANTNALIAAHNSPGVPRDRFSAMTRLDQNRACGQLAKKAGVRAADVCNVTIWGNHSSTQYPDAENARIKDQPAYEVITDHHWLKNDFITGVQQRGSIVIATRGHSSAGSAGNAIGDHVQSFMGKTPEGRWFSAAVPSDGSYGVDEGLMFSFPVSSNGQGGYHIVQGLTMSNWAKTQFNATLKELRREREIVSDLLK
jgi:malate dehydrogenase